MLSSSPSPVSSLLSCRQNKKQSHSSSKTTQSFGLLDFPEMDLLCNAYCNASDNEEAEAEGIKETFTPPNPKRLKPDNPFAHTKFHHPLPESTQFPTTQAEAPVPGRYISKRERALLATQPTVPEPNPNPNAPVTTLPVFGSISDSDVRRDVMSLLRNKGKKGPSQLGQLPQRMSVALNRHTKAVNAVHWSPTHAHLLASASMDHTICIWNVWSSDQKVAGVLNFHSAAVKDVKWSQQGLSVLSCGYDSSSRLVDVEKGLEIQVFKEDQVVSVIKFHPDNSNLFISGGSKGGIRLWDVRSGKVVHEYIRGHDPILDLEFSTNSKQIISSSDVSGRNLSENSIVVWDVSRQVPLSNQVYVEAFTCPCVRSHPFEPFFVAQSNGNYIAIFSLSPPFKLNKYKRYESHGVSGFPIKCVFSLDGEKLVSGSSDGSLYFYDYRSSELVRKIKAYEQACIDVAIHPVMPNVIASCSWNGEVSVFE